MIWWQIILWSLYCLVFILVACVFIVSIVVSISLDEILKRADRLGEAYLKHKKASDAVKRHLPFQ